ncbi:alkaline phosphatase D family protein [Steroidobacter cummioxidans]|uniref:alkaline phosphatase D family protein n=1 Tax=Steroidobacter cummioxidans TaxID=1803913 RepID=UPI0019D49B94|nr:alkaline phosphatase D family protein [Steroidobacter cummioxidans]
MMHRLTRRELIQAAAAMGATLALPAAQGAKPRTWREAPDIFAEGVASGDPTSDSVLLWTRVSVPSKVSAVPLTVEVSDTPRFEHLVASASTRALAAADHTCRVLVAGLEPARVYWYRFIDASGRGSRIGRTRTAAAPGDTNPVKFAFVSCQNVCEGAQNAYRRMMYEDERAAAADQLAFVLHLGDFIYEVIDYPEDVPGGHRYDRRIRDVVRYPQGEKVGRFHIPVTLADYRTVYRAYLRDPDLQAARARWPFVAMWDNHEFSWMGWQSQQRFDRQNRPAQTRKVAANQAWFEYQPARVARPGKQSLERFKAPAVKDVPLQTFDAHGLSSEPNNIAAIDSLIGYRALQWGQHLQLIITDQHSYRSEEPTSRPEAAALDNPNFPELIPQEIIERLDAGEGGRPPQTILGQRQKRWFLETLQASKQTWKVWGNSLGTLDWRADPQNLPAGVGERWPGAGYACFGGGGDYGTAYRERAEIYDYIRDAAIANFVTVSGDRHSFWAGLASKALPPSTFDPVGAAFITGSISAPGLVEAFEHRFPKDHPLRALYIADRGGKQEPAVNLLLHHGVLTCLEYAKSGDLQAALRLSNPSLAPHLKFLDLGGHGYATLRVSGESAECEFVCIPRPLERSFVNDGGPMLYRVRHTVDRWKAGERPVLRQQVIEGDPGLSL